MALSPCSCKMRAHRATPRYSRTPKTTLAKSGDFMSSIERGRGSGTSTTDNTHPGAVPMTTTRSEKDRLDDAMRHEDDGLATVLPDAQELEVQPFAREFVDRPKRLIHQDNLWIDNQHPAERGALLHAARQLGGIGTLAVLEPDQSENVPGSLHGAPSVEPEDLDRQ